MEAFEQLIALMEIMKMCTPYITVRQGFSVKLIPALHSEIAQRSRQVDFM
jgi:hypothetical protein